MDKNENVLDDRIMNYVPVLIPTLNRYKHLKECIDSLEKCVGAEKTELYISVDYPPNKEYEEGHRQVCEYLRNKEFSKFKDVHLFFQEQNIGSYDNFYFLEAKIKDNDSWFIAIEDDLVFSESYLLYINEAVQLFGQDDCFAGVCGYSNLRKVGDEQGWYKGYELTYGSAYNRRVVNFVKNKAKSLYAKPVGFSDFFRLMIARPREARIYVDYFIYKPRLYFDRYGNIAPIDYVIQNVFFYSKLYVVTPVISLVRNMGGDGSGQHSGYNRSVVEYEQSKKLDNSITFDFTERSFVKKRTVNSIIKTNIGIKCVLVNYTQALIKYILIATIGMEKTRILMTRKNR